MEPFTLREGPVAVRPLRPQDATPASHLDAKPPGAGVLRRAGTWPTHRENPRDFYAPEEGARRCLVEFEGAPVGYIQITSWTPGCARSTTTPISRGSSSLA